MCVAHSSSLELKLFEPIDQCLINGSILLIYDTMPKLTGLLTVAEV